MLQETFDIGVLSGRVGKINAWLMQLLSSCLLCVVTGTLMRLLFRDHSSLQNQCTLGVGITDGAMCVLIKCEAVIEGTRFNACTRPCSFLFWQRQVLDASAAQLMIRVFIRVWKVRLLCFHFLGGFRAADVGDVCSDLTLNLGSSQGKQEANY